MELTQDPNTVYYIHPSDNTGMKLVTTPFNGTCYGSWKRSMTIGLTAKNKLCFIDGTLCKPDVDANNYNSWCRCNSMVIGWLISALEPQIASSILYVDSAREIWLDLEERFGQASSAQLYALEQEVIHISQDNLTLSEYYTELKKLWDEIDNLKPLTGCACNLTQKVHKLQLDQRLMIFLMKMSNIYANIRSHILMMETLPTLPQVYKMLLQEQRHREISKMNSVISEPVAFYAEKRFPQDKNLQSQTNRNQYTRRILQHLTMPTTKLRKLIFVIIVKFQDIVRNVASNSMAIHLDSSLLNENFLQMS